ncbi:protein of unknown function [Rhodovastum atsumiense]|nr:protein of unknown function [Rhodovastum atsumiense]
MSAAQAGERRISLRPLPRAVEDGIDAMLAARGDLCGGAGDRPRPPQRNRGDPCAPLEAGKLDGPAAKARLRGVQGQGPGVIPAPHCGYPRFHDGARE